MSDWPIRRPERSETAALARLWHVGWHDAHAAIVPDALRTIRVFDDFQTRLPGLMPQARTAGPLGHPLALCVVEEDELYQLYVHAQARGSGLAARLLADAEVRIGRNGFAMARLDVAIGNDRAQRFYAKHGWQTDRPMAVDLRTTSGPFRLEILRMTKPLAP